MIAFSSKDRRADAGETSPTLRAMGHADSHPNAGGQVAIAFNHQENRSFVASSSSTNPLRANQTEAIFIQDDTTPKVGVAGALRRDAGGKGACVACEDVAQPVRSNRYNNSAPGMEARMHVQQGMAVRRLSVVECSRLQGFSDSYLTQVTWRGKSPPSDGPMYKALGNSFAVPVVRWIGERIQLVDRLYS